MKNFRFAALSFFLILALSGCSGSSVDEEVSDEEMSGEDIPVADAGTDSVPEEGIEQPGDSVTEAPSDAGIPETSPPPPIAETEESATVAEAPPAPAEATGPESSYTVQAGDTLMKIAFETYGDVYQWRKIYNLNADKISDHNNIPPGTVLRVEQPASPVSIERNGEQYLIKRGDTLGTISQDVYGTPKKWRKLWENNRQLIKDPNRIYAGFYLYYVPESGTPPMAEGSEPEAREPSSASQPPAAPSAPVVAPQPASPPQAVAPVPPQPVQTQ